MSTQFMIPNIGLTNDRLSAATADVSDVINGKTFYSGNNEIKTGTFNLGAANAGTGDVMSGKKFYSGDKTLKTGTLVPRLKLLKSASRTGSGTISITVTGYSVYYFVFDDYGHNDCKAKTASQGSWGLVLDGSDIVFAERIGCNPNTNTTFSLTYYLGGDFERHGWVYVIG